MSRAPAHNNRWNAAVTQAAENVLSARWRSTLEALERARHEYRVLYAATATDVRAVRKAAQRVYELEQLRTVLAGELRTAS
jgi:Spy/CpxP family protein refolding chaperone